MTKTMTNAEQIARSLSEAQRRVLDGPYGYGDQFDSGRIRGNLIAMGLIESGQGLRLSSLGQQVREILIRESQS